MNHLTILALALAGANAAGLSKRQYSEADQYSDSDDYLQQVCAPVDEAGNRDWSAPCNAVMSIQYECGYGAAGGELIRGPPKDINDQFGGDDEGPPEQPYDAQRICVCQSQFRDQVAGCMKCFKDHGGVEGNDWWSPSLIDPAMKDYCNASAPATESFADFLFTRVSPNGETDTESGTAESSTFSDPIGNKTDVSLYFTPSVTGTPAYIPAMPTPESSGGNVTYTSWSTSDGEIVPTAVGDERAQSSGGAQSSGSAQSGTQSGTQSAAATASSDAGAVQTAMAHSGTFGALGLAALMAAL